MRYTLALITLCIVIGSRPLTSQESCPLTQQPRKSTRFPSSSESATHPNEFATRAQQIKGDFKAATALAAEYLDARSKVASSLNVPDPTQDVLSILHNFRGLGLDQPDWKRAQILDQLPNVEGFLQQADHTTIYLRGQRQHAVRVYQDGHVEVLSPESASTEYRDYCRHDIRKHSTDAMALFDVENTSDGGREVYIGGRALKITPAEYRELTRGRPLPKTHPLTLALESSAGTAKVLYSNPMMQKQGAAMRGADEFAFAIQRSYPDIPIYRDPLSPRTNEIVKRLNDFTISGPKEVVAVVADESFRPRPKDYNLIQDLKGELVDLGIRVVTYKPGVTLAAANANGKALIVITGHSDAELAAFVRTLGSQGVFKNSYVLFNSCETPLSRQLITEINTRYGASATFAHEGKVLVDDLDPFLEGFAKRISTIGDKNFGRTLLQTLHEHRLNGVWTICERLLPGLRHETAEV